MFYILLACLLAAVAANRCSQLNNENVCLSQGCGWCPNTTMCVSYNPCENTDPNDICPDLIWPQNINCGMYTAILYTSGILILLSLVVSCMIFMCSLRFGCKRECVNINFMLWPCVFILGVGFIVTFWNWSAWSSTGNPYYYNYAINSAVITVMIPIMVILCCVLALVYFAILYCINPRGLRSNLRECNQCMGRCCGRGVLKLYSPVVTCFAWLCDKITCAREPIYPDIYTDSYDDGL